MDTRGPLNLTERSPGSTGNGVVTITDGTPSNTVREARIVWDSTNKKLMSVGNGIEGIESSIWIPVVLRTRSFGGVVCISV